MTLALLTDLYQLTMGAGYHRAGLADRRACFHLFFRRNPFKGGYAIAAGLDTALDYLESLRFGDEERDYLRSLRGPDGGQLFPEDFLDRLRDATWDLDVAAVPEGTVMFPHEPLLRIEGPLWQAQLVETALLNILNFQTLVATKASRVCRAATTDGVPDKVLEFGLRRAQGIDGALSASRAAFVGGCTATSNVLAGQRFGIPVQGTHAHAWVMSFETEREAFEAYADVFPSGCVFLVDTYDTLQGVRTAIEVGLDLRARGMEMQGVRLDSGDLAELSIAARALLDEAGFPDAAIVASNDLDEHRIAEIKEKGGPITVWGVGTRLSTCYDQPALGGVYKLAAVQDEDGQWQPRIKLSENPIKTSIPTRQQVRRFTDGEGRIAADAIYDVATGFSGSTIHDPEDETRVHDVPADCTFQDLLEPVFAKGARLGTSPTVHEARERALAQVKSLPPAVASNRTPARFPSGLETDLHTLRRSLIEAARKESA